MLREATWTHKKNSENEYLFDLEQLKIAVRNGADVDSCGTLEWAVRNNNLDVVKYMLKNKANVNYQDDDCKWTSLMMASDSGYVDIAKVLIDYNADPLIGNFQAITALDILTPNSFTKDASFGYESCPNELKKKRDEIVKYLLQHIVNKTPELLYKYIKYLGEEQKEKFKDIIALGVDSEKYNL